MEIYQKSSYFSIEIEKNIEKSRKITEISISLEKSRSRLKSTGLANLIETKSRNLDLDQDFSIIETNFLNCQDFLDRRDWYFFGVEITSRSRRDHVETNRDPQA